MLNVLYLVGSLSVRVGTVLLVTVLLARWLEPGLFGTLMIGATFGGLAGILADLGSSLSSLRNMGADLSTADETINRAFSTKLTILFATFGLALVSSAVFITTPVEIVCFLAGFIGLCTTSLSDLAIVAFRALQRNREELIANLASNALSVVVFLLGSIFAKDASTVCLVYVISRVLALAAILIGVRMGANINIRIRLMGLRQILSHAQTSGSWALYVNAAYINSQIDAFSVTYLFGTTANGIYQSAARFMSGAGQVPGIANSYWIPRIARARAERKDHKRLETEGCVAIITAGVVVCAAFSLVGPIVTTNMLPAGYQASMDLWTPLGILLLCRFIAAAGNMRAVSANLPHVSVVSEVVALSINIGGLFFVAPRFGMPAVPLVLAAGALGTFVSSTILLKFKS